MKVVINKCYGGYGLSKKAYNYLGIEWDNYGYCFNDDRSNAQLVECVEELGEAANGELSELKVVEIPDDVEWTIIEYDGVEWVAEVHRTWD